MKAVLISIQPKWCELIASGKKTVEIRKTKPRIETPFKCYIYCSDSGKDVFYRSVYSYDDLLYTPKHKGECKRKLIENGHSVYNGRVIGEFMCDFTDEVYQCHSGWVGDHACLSRTEFFDYLGIPHGTHLGYDKKAYAWFISDLVIYDKPKSIGEFCKPCDPDPQCDCQYCMTHGRSPSMTIKRAPQSWRYVEERR